MPTATGDPRPNRFGWAVGLVALVALYAWTHQGLLDRGFTSDEVSLLFPGGWWHLVHDVQTAVNPPWLRWLLSQSDDPGAGLAWGRRLSWGGGVIGIAMGYWCCARWSRSIVVAVAVMAAVVLDPVFTEVTAMARVYGLWFAVMVGYLGASAAWLERPGWREGLVVGGLALLLPQLHYFSAPLLLGTGLTLAAVGARPVAALALHLPSAAGFVGWLPVVLRGAENRHAPPEAGWWDALQQVTGVWAPDASLAALAVVGVAVVSVALAVPSGRFLAGTLGSLVLATWLFGRGHLFTPHAAIFGTAVFPLVVAAGLGGLDRTRWRRPQTVASAALGVWALVALGTAARDQPHAHELRSRDGVATFAQRWPEWVGPDEEVVVDPFYEMQPLLLAVRGELLGDGPTPEACAGEPRCFVKDGTRFVGGSLDSVPRDRPVVVLHTAWRPPEALPEGCVQVEPAPAVRLIRCAPL